MSRVTPGSLWVAPLQANMKENVFITLLWHWLQFYDNFLNMPCQTVYHCDLLWKILKNMKK